MAPQIKMVRLICSSCILTILTACGSGEPQAVPVLPPRSPVEAEIAEPRESSSGSQNGVVRPTEPTDEVLQRVTSATVRVVGDDFTGSGVLIGQDAKGRAYILTVWHGAQKRIRQVELYSITSAVFPKPFLTLSPVELVSKSPRRDLAILRTVLGDETLELPKLQLAKEWTLEAPVFSCGCANGPPILLPEEVSQTVHSRRPGQSEPTKMWKTDLPQEVGRSGGPLINLNGELIGIALGRGGQNGYYCHLEEIAGYFVDSPLNLRLECGTQGSDL